MKRSLRVSAPLVAGVALALATGCRKQQMQRCVDEQDRVVPDSFCQNPQTSSPSGVPIPIYRFYYGGFGSYQVGSTVSGGGYTSIRGSSYATGTSRGGFGSSVGGGSSSASGDDAGSGS